MNFDEARKTGELLQCTEECDLFFPWVKKTYGIDVSYAGLLKFSPVKTKEIIERFRAEHKEIDWNKVSIDFAKKHGIKRPEASI